MFSDIVKSAIISYYKASYTYRAIQLAIYLDHKVTVSLGALHFIIKQYRQKINEDVEKRKIKKIINSEEDQHKEVIEAK